MRLTELKLSLFGVRYIFSMACKRKNPGYYLSTGDDQPTDLPPGVKRMEIFKAFHDLPTVGNIWQNAIKFPDCIGVEELKSVSGGCVPSTFKDNIYFPKIVNMSAECLHVTVVNSVKDTTASFLHPVDRIEMSTWFTEEKVQTDKIDNMSNIGKKIAIDLSAQACGLPVANNAIFSHEASIDLVTNDVAQGTPAVPMQPGGLRATVTSRKRFGKCGYMLASDTLYMNTFIAPNNAAGKLPVTGGFDLFQCRYTIDYKLSPVSFEELWVKQQNFAQYKPEILRWSYNKNAQCFANMGTVSNDEDTPLQ